MNEPQPPPGPPSTTRRPPHGRYAVRVALSLFAAALALSGCGQSVLPSPDVGAAGFGTHAHGTVTVWARAATQKSDQLMGDAFNRSHKGVRVEVTAVPDTQYVTKLATAIRSGNVPDAVDLDDVNTTLLAYHDALTDLTPLLRRLPFADRLSKGHLDLATLGGHSYAVPLAADVSVLYYNRALFRRAGLDPAEPPHGYAQILADARRITALGHGIKGMSLAGQNAGTLGFTSFPGMWSDGGHLLTGAMGHQRAVIAGNKPLADMLAFNRALWRGKLVPPASRSETGATYGQDCMAGRVGMWSGSYGVLAPQASPSFLRRIGAVPLTGRAGRLGGFPGGDDIAIPRGSHNAGGAWEFIRFALGTAQQARLPRTGFTPVRSDVATPAWRRAHPLDAVSVDALQHAGMDKTIAYNVLINQQSGPFLALYTKTVFGDADIASALRSAQGAFARTLDDSQT